MEEKQIPKGPFTKARVVKIIRENTKGHIISNKVKDAMNHWLGEIAKKVAIEMGKSRYATLDLDDFKAAIKKYEIAERLDAERERLLKGLEKIEADLEAMKADIKSRIRIKEKTL